MRKWRAAERSAFHGNAQGSFVQVNRTSRGATRATPQEAVMGFGVAFAIFIRLVFSVRREGACPILPRARPARTQRPAARLQRVGRAHARATILDAVRRNRRPRESSSSRERAVANEI